jgi:PhnB protein
MRENIKAIPDGYEGTIPCLVCKDAGQAVSFYKRAFGATETMRIEGPGGAVMHAEIRIGKAVVMLGEECPQMGGRSPQLLGGTPVSLYLYVNDVDALALRAEEVGAKVRRPVTDQFWGDRTVELEDPFGHRWSFATRIENVSPDETHKRAQEFFAKGA